MLFVRNDLMTKLRGLARKVELLKIPRGVSLILPESEQDKLGWLAGNRREFEKTTPELLQRVTAAFNKEARAIVEGRSRSKNAPWIAAGVEVARQISIRIAAGDGGDVKMKPLKASTIERKRRDGVANPSAIGYHTGKLYRAVRAIVDRKKVRVEW